MHTETFASLVAAVTRVKGAPSAPHAFIPQPLVGKTAGELYAYLAGDSPVTGRPVMADVVAGLTQTPPEAATADGARTRLLDPAGEDDLHELFRERGWTDQLPIVLPTEARVEAMLAGTSRGRDEHVGSLAPTDTRDAWPFTVEQVAVNAVLAGARPEYLPVILALASTGATARSSSTTSYAAMAVVNGPVRQQLGMNAGLGALGPYNHANATIGRAWSLLSQNLQGGSVPGLTYMGSQGNGLAYASMCFAENEEASPWEPLHVQHGFDREASVVTAFLGGRTMLWSISLPDAVWPETLGRILAASDPLRGPVLLLDPLAARKLVALGFGHKRELAEWIAEHVRIRAGEYWELSEHKLAYYPLAAGGEEPWASMLAAGPDELLPLFRPEQVETVVVGGETIASWRVAGALLRGQASVDDWR